MATLPFLPQVALFTLFAAAIVVTLSVPHAMRSAILRSVWQLRWLLAAVVVVYAFLSPGDGVEWTATLARGAMLVSAVVAVRLALFGVPADALAAGLVAVLAPLRVVGVRADRFAHRLVLTLDAVPEVQALVARTAAPTHGSSLARLTARAAAVIDEIEA